VPRVLVVDPLSPEPEIIAEAARVLSAGGLVVFPTETVYGLGARGLRPAEIARIYEAKGRPAGHPLILHVDDEAMARSVASVWSDRTAALATRFWPGPLTLVVPRGAHVPSEVSGGLATVGIRQPDHRVALALIAAVGEPLAAPSANAHTHVSPTTAEHVVRSLGDRVDLVLDAGPCPGGLESTVVLVDSPLRVLRPGGITLDQLRAIDPDVVDGTTALEGDAARAAPGMAAKHYAPRTRVVLARRHEVGAAITSARTAAIVATASGQSDAAACEPLIVLEDEPNAYARALYAALHTADAAQVDLIVIEAPPENDPAWWAVRDRVQRAARD